MNTAIPASGSVLDRVKNRRAEFEQQRSASFEIPGYSGMLKAKYGPMTLRSTQAINERAEKTLKHDQDKDLLIVVDSLVAACEGIILVEVNDKGETVETEIATGFNKALAEILDIAQDEEHPLRAREIVRLVFPSDLAIVSHGDEWATWSRDGSTNDDEVLAGE